MNIIERIFLFARTKEIAVSTIEKKSGISNGLLKKIKHSPSNQKCEDILNSFPELSRDWLFLGEGEMLKSELSEQNHYQIIAETNNSNLHQEQINTLQKEIQELNKQIGRLEGKLDGKEEVINILKEELHLLKKDFQTPIARGAKRAV